jgi:hypothetical protein
LLALPPLVAYTEGMSGSRTGSRYHMATREAGRSDMTKAGNQNVTQPDTQPTGPGTNPTLWGRISQALAPRPAGQAAAQAGKKPGVGFGRVAIGLVAYMFGSMALQYVVLLADSVFKLHLSTTTQTLFPTSLPIIGSMTKFELIYLLLLLAYVWLLFRLNVIPRDLFRPRTATSRGGSSSTSTTTTLGRSKSARRRAGLTATTSSPATNHGTTTRSGAAARAARAEAKADTGDDDNEYDRVRSLMRRRRKH